MKHRLKVTPLQMHQNKQIGSQQMSLDVICLVFTNIILENEKEITLMIKRASKTVYNVQLNDTGKEI